MPDAYGRFPRASTLVSGVKSDNGPKLWYRFTRLVRTQELLSLLGVEGRLLTIADLL
jgi:hypothetical protein